MATSELASLFLCPALKQQKQRAAKRTQRFSGEARRHGIDCTF
jgi:hypothetical protein